MTVWKIAVLVTLIAYVVARPSDGSFSASAQIQTDHKPLISFENGKVGVNFLGYHAAAGLGGLLTGNAADGGLHAEAGTPWGQQAGAGLGGTVNGNGKSAGGLYAGATAGGGVSAAAGLEGETSASGSYGQSFAGASNGHSETHITKVKSVAPAANKAISGSFSASVNAAPVKEVEIIEEVKPKTTYVERTVIPNYVEKTIQVPSYVEKTVRVPTVVEKKVRVPAPPTIIEKTVDAPEAHYDFDTRGNFGGEGVAVIQKTKVRPLHHFRKAFYYGGYGGGGYGGGYGGGGYGGGAGSATGTATVTKTINGDFFNNIFNIPISTLAAVNRLVNGIAGGASGSISVQKSYGAY